MSDDAVALAAAINGIQTAKQTINAKDAALSDALMQRDRTSFTVSPSILTIFCLLDERV